MKFLVFYNNGLVTTNILIIAKDEDEAKEIFKTECESDVNFVNNNCFGGKCEFLYVMKAPKLERK